MLFTELTGRKVVSTDNASTVGVVADYLVDPEVPAVVALILSKTPGQGSVLPWANVMAVGNDAVTVPTAEAIITPDDYLTKLSGARHALPGKRVLTTAGEDVGTVRNVEFDQATGRLDALIMESGPIAPDRLLGVGSYAAIVRAVHPGA